MTELTTWWGLVVAIDFDNNTAVVIDEDGAHELSETTQ